MSEIAEQIAAGGEPVWQATFPHPDHGDLTFTVKHMPVARDWLEHYTTMQDLAPGVNSMLSAGIAGMLTFMDRPVLAENRVEDPDNPTHVRIEKVLYDPLEEQRFEFVMEVWATFTAWRVETLSDETRGAVKNSSGATTTSGSETDESSPGITEFPPSTSE
jgi:hypothetical protein